MFKISPNQFDTLYGNGVWDWIGVQARKECLLFIIYCFYGYGWVMDISSTLMLIELRFDLLDLLLHNKFIIYAPCFTHDV